MPRTVLLTLGRLPKALDIARSFRRLGWRVLVAEPFARHLTGISRAVERSFVVGAPTMQRERYLKELAAIVARESVELVVPVSEEIFHASYVQPRLPPTCRFFGMAPRELLRLHDKQAFVRRCHEFGLDAPETHALDAPAAARLARAAAVVVKPVLSCSGRGVRFLAPGAPLPTPAAAGHAIVQQFVEGEVLTSFSIARAGRTLATVIYRGAVLSGTVAVCFERVPAQPAVQAWVERFVACSGWTGFISFDFLVTPAGRVYGVECNPRATSGIHFVEPAALAPLILAALDDPATTANADRSRPALRAAPLMQQFYPCLTETQDAFLRRNGRFRHNLRHLMAARDVTWSWRDPLPFLTMPWTSWPIIAAAMRRKCTFGEVATLDIGWYDEALHRTALPAGE
jgi:hypothetical protein